MAKMTFFLSAKQFEKDGLVELLLELPDLYRLSVAEFGSIVLRSSQLVY